MLLVIGILVTLTAVLIILTVRVPGGVAAAPLGWMSEQWLAEHLASHSS